MFEDLAAVDRVQHSKVGKDLLDAMKGKGIEGLATGVGDGQENTWSNIYTQKFYEVQKSIAETNHGVIDYMVITNAKWWDSLLAEVRKGLSEARDEATAYGNKLANDINERDCKLIAGAGKAKIFTRAKRVHFAHRRWATPTRASGRSDEC